jgi:hypothetical protein
MLDALFGDSGRKQELDDFIARYRSGPPWDGIAADEALRRCQEVARQAPADLYRDAAEDAFTALTADQRRAFHGWLRTALERDGIVVPGNSATPSRDEPAGLAVTVAELRESNPGWLEQQLGRAAAAGGAGTMGASSPGGIGGEGAGPSAGGLGFAGLMQPDGEGGRGAEQPGERDLADPLIARGTLAGIAAAGLQRMMTRR